MCQTFLNYLRGCDFLSSMRADRLVGRDGDIIIISFSGISGVDGRAKDLTEIAGDP